MQQAFRFSTLFISAALGLGGCVSAPVEAASFASCQELRIEFPTGVAADDADSSALDLQPVRDQRIYATNIGLDSDADLMACEHEPIESAAPPEVLPVNNSEFFFFRYNDNGELERRGNLSDEWVTWSYETTEVSEIRKRAFEEIKSLKSNGKPEVSWTIGPNVPGEMVEAYRIQVDQVLESLDFEKLQNPIELVMFSELDEETISDYWSLYWFGEETVARHKTQLEFLVGDDAVNSSVGGASNIRQPYSEELPRVGVDFYMSSVHTQETNLLIDHVPHEMFHAWHWHALGLAEKIKAGERFDVQDYLPCHATEGAATTIGTALLVPHADWYSDNADVISRRIANQAGIEQLTEEMAIDLLRKGQSWSTCEEAYAIGMLAHEYLIGSFGIEKFLQIYWLAGDRVPYSAAISQLYDLELEEFYSMASPYIVSEFNRALQKSN